MIKGQLNANQDKSPKQQTIGNYNIEETIGEGTFGKVKLGTHLLTKQKVAIKILEKTKIKDKDALERVNREIKFLKKLKHNNIIQLYEIIESATTIFLIMEYAKQGEFFNYIVKNTRLDEKEASMFFAQIINGIEFIHQSKIAHRDLKPENLLLDENKLIKIIDFGLSNSFSGGILLKTPCGSPCYAAPEMLLGKKYDGVKIDIWSSGIILYAMVCGFLPFEDEDNTKLYQQILECNLEFPFDHSDECLDMIRRLLCTNPEERITVPEIKNHFFFRQGQAILNEMNHNILYNPEQIYNHALSKMAKLGFKKEFIQKYLRNGEYNNVTATFHIIYNQIKIDRSTREPDFHNIITNTVQNTVLETLPNKVQSTVQNTLIFNEISTSKINISDRKSKLSQEENINNSYDTGNYANEICTTEILGGFDKSNENFFKEEKKKVRVKKTKTLSQKVKQVSIDIIKSKTPSYNKVFSNFQKSNNHNHTENIVTDDNHHENSKYIKTETNFIPKKCFTPTLSMNEKQNSLKNINRKTPITLSYNIFAIKKKENASKPSNNAFNFKNKFQMKATSSSNVNNTTKFAYVKLKLDHINPDKSKERSSLVSNKKTHRHISKDLSKERKPKNTGNSPVKKNDITVQNIHNLNIKDKQPSKPLTSSYVKYLAYSSRYKHQSSSDNKMITNKNNHSNIKNSSNPKYKDIPSASSHRVFSDNSSVGKQIKKDTFSKSPIPDKISNVNSEIQLTTTSTKPQKNIVNTSNFNNKKQILPSTFKTCQVKDTSFDLMEKITKLCQSHKIMIKEAKNNLLKCDKNKNMFCIEIGNAAEKGTKLLKFYHISGLKEVTKNVVKSFLLNFGG